MEHVMTRHPTTDLSPLRVALASTCHAGQLGSSVSRIAVRRGVDCAKDSAGRTERDKGMPVRKFPLGCNGQERVQALVFGISSRPLASSDRRPD